MVNIYIQGQLLDQYDDEVIELTSSVLDVGDLTKNTGDFSKTFTIPASPNNNKHFKGILTLMEYLLRQVNGDCQKLLSRMVSLMAM